MNTVLSGISLKRRILKRMRERGIAPERIAMASRVRFPSIPHECILGKSTKTNKNTREGMLTAIVYLAPHKLSVPYGGKNLCPWATTCVEPCLATKNRLGPGSDGENAELWRTLTYLWAREEFKALLSYAITLHEGRARKARLKCGVRLNGGSDVVWETTLPEVFSGFPHVQFYDYTKSILRMFSPRPANYDLTFSFDGLNLVECKRVLRAGMNVAIVASDPQTLLERKLWRGFPTLNGDAHDCRPSDKKGYWVVLGPKGNATDDTGFFYQAGKA